MAYGDDSDLIRKRAWERYIHPRIQQGAIKIDLAIKPLMKEMEAEGFPPNHPRQFCKALQKKTFLQEKGLVLEHVEGPPSGTSTTVVLHLRVTKPHELAGELMPGSGDGNSPQESPEDKSYRLTEKIRGMFKEEIDSFGGPEAFMRWVRSDEDEAA